MMKKLILFLAFSLIMTLLYAGILPQRTELSLNGRWDFTPDGRTKTSIEVPDYWDAHPEFSGVERAIYERMVSVPDSSAWNDKILKIEFEGINFIADIYINNKLIANHIGGWIPFSVDITKYVRPGVAFSLKVDVKGGSYQPIIDTSGAPQWPVGFIGQEAQWGIVFDAWLRAYGTINISDAFIQTSYCNKSIRVDYEVKNEKKKAVQITICSRISPALPAGQTVFEMNSGTIELKPGELRIVTLGSKWESPHFWTPDDPFLYYLESVVREFDSNTETDRELRRFGFREIWVEGNKLLFNGHRITLMGTNIVQHSEFHNSQRYWYMTPETWNQSIDRLFELNLRTVRFHMQPAPKFILDIADERGLLVMDESAIYAREYILKSNKQVYIANSLKWIEFWIKARRNHPSIVVWNAENEMGTGWIKWMNESELKSLGDAIRLYDITRPVNYDGDDDVGDALVNLHYPEVYKETVKGSIYSWDDKVRPDKPTGVGEFITHYGENGLINQWWQGTWVRGMRYVYFSDIRPYRHDWAWLHSGNNDRTENLKNGFAPVALFDKEYDDLGIDPFVKDVYPVLNSGDTVSRILVLYNDEFQDTIITIEVLVKSSETYQAIYNYNGNRTSVQKVVAQGSRTCFVPLGEHVDIPYSFQVPAIYEGFVDYIDVELIARKNGELKFRETKRFTLRNLKFQGNTSSKILISEPQKSQYSSL